MSNKEKGFASMTPEQRKRIASAGGKAAHAKGVAHRWTREEASEMGKRGGKVSASKPGHMSEIGRKGGRKRHHHE